MKAADKKAPTPAIDSVEAAETLCRELFQTMETLHQVMDAETGHLKAMNIAEAERLQARKSELARAYIRDIATFKAQAKAVAALAPDGMAALSRTHKGLRASILENEAVLEALRTVSTALIRRTAEKVAAKSGGPRTYSRDAALPTVSGNAAVALNRKA